MDIYISIPNNFGQTMSQNDIERSLKLNFIIDQYRQGNISLKESYRYLDMSETEFLHACHERGVPRQTYIDEQELMLEFGRVSQQYAQKSDVL